MNLRWAFVYFFIAIPIPSANAAWGLYWRDEFNGAKAQPPDAGKWVYDVGAGGWGNHELETYTRDAANVFLDGHGHLVIRALKSDSGGYTSGRIKTQGKFEFRYGRIAARIKVPQGPGLWPAFWMLGSDADKTGWPGCGEIDIMENIGKEPALVHGTAHGPEYSGADGISFQYALAPPRPFAERFHTYEAEWEPARIRLSVDGHAYAEITPGSIPSNAKWVFDHPFSLLLNLAVGGDWPGPPDNTTPFPRSMLVDWVRVWRRSQ
jgi:beta-glucanase (GH16 family)